MQGRHALAIAGGAAAAALALRSALRRRRRIAFHGRVVLITGGSRGLGLELARVFGREGARVALLARDEETLARAEHDLRQRGVDVLAIAADVGDRREAEDTVDQVVRHFGRLDVVVNAAGSMLFAPLTQTRAGDYREMLRVYFWGPYYLSRAALAPMRRQGGGRIVDIVSIGGRVALPHLAPYTVGKFALAGWSGALRAEVRRDGIRVTTVYPGLMRTGSHLHAMFRGRARGEFAWFAALAGNPLASIDVARAARAIVDASRHGDARLILSLPARAAALIEMLAPGLFAAGAALAHRLLPPPVEGPTETVTGAETHPGGPLRLLTFPADRAAPGQNQV